MATIEAEVPTAEAVDTDAIITEELIERETEFFATRPRTVRIQDPRGFVESALRAHSDTIVRWGGTRFHTGVVQTEGPCQLTDVQNLMMRIWNERNQLLIPDTHVVAGYWDPCGRTNWPKPVIDYNFWLNRKATYNDYYIYGGGQCAVQMRANQIISRAVLGDIKKRFKDRDPEQLREYLRIWEKFFAELGTLHSGSRPLRATFSVSPGDFAWLGEIESSAGRATCYRNGGEWERSKFNLALTKHSFVSYLYRESEVSDEESADALLYAGRIPDARLWGFATPHGVYASNLYRLEWPTVEPSMPALLSEAFGYDPALTLVRVYGATADNIRNYASSYAYMNGDGRTFVRTGVTSAAREANQIQHDFVSAYTEWSANPQRIGDGTQRCGTCNHSVRTNQIHQCELCDAEVCRYCELHCAGNDDNDIDPHYYCRDCAHTINCWNCGTNVCSDCVENAGVALMRSCQGCGNSYCNRCSRNFVHCTGCPVDASGFCTTCRGRAGYNGYTIHRLNPSQPWQCHAHASDELRAYFLDHMHQEAIEAYEAHLLREQRLREDRINRERERFMDDFFGYMTRHHGVGWYYPVHDRHHRVRNCHYFNDNVADAIHYALINGHLDGYAKYPDLDPPAETNVVDDPPALVIDNFTAAANQVMNSIIQGNVADQWAREIGRQLNNNLMSAHQYQAQYLNFPIANPPTPVVMHIIDDDEDDPDDDFDYDGFIDDVARLTDPNDNP